MSTQSSADLQVDQLIDTLVDKLTNGKQKFTMFSISEFDMMDKKLQIATASIRHLRNSSQSVNQLPLEILSTVLHEAHPEYHSFMPVFNATHVIRYSDDGWARPVSRDDIINRSYSHQWLSLSGVCRRWRDAFNACPTLWSTIDGVFQLDKFLDRSGDTPLAVHLGTGTHISEENLAQIALHSLRLTQLHMDVNGYDGAVTFDQLLSRPAPSLSSLTLKYAGPSQNGWGPVTGVSSLPSLFNDEMPRLKQLSLSYYTSWPRGYFQNLTHLLLFDQIHVGRPTTSMFLDFLEASPLLEELALVNAGPNLDDEDDLPAASPYRTVSLFRLRELNIGDWPTASTVARLLSHLHIPSTASMHLWGSTVYEDLASFIPSDPFGLENLTTITEWQFIRIQNSASSHSYGDGRGLRFYISIKDSILYMYGPFQERHLLTIASRYPLQCVRTLTIVDSAAQKTPHISSETWSGLFQYLPLLTSLRIVAGSRKTSSYSATRHIVSALYSPEKSFDNDSENGFDTLTGPCPLLTTLIIEEESLVPTLHIVSLAEERAKTKHPIKRLELISTVIPPRRPSGGMANAGIYDPWSSTEQHPTPYDSALTTTDVSFLKRNIEEVVVERKKPPQPPQSLIVFEPYKWPTLNRILVWTRGSQYGW